MATVSNAFELLLPSRGDVLATRNSRLSNRACAVAAIRGQLQETQWLSQSDITNRQQTLLDDLVNHSYSNSPWFKHRLSVFGLTPKQLLTPQGFERLPLIRRKDIQEAGDSFFCQAVPPNYGYVATYKTTGSTGEPIEVRRTELNEIDLLATTLRDHDWHQRDFGKRDCGVRIHSSEAILMPNWAAPVSLLFDSAPLLILPLSWNISTLVTRIFEFQPAYLQVFPSMLAGMRHELEQDGRRFYELKEIRVFGEALSADSRQDESEFFGVPIIDNYCSQEIGIIACQCPITTNLHVCSEFLLVEVLDERGRPCEVGEIGRIVVTDLRNFATPLIRYEIGDWAEVGPKCSCGREGLVLRRVLGRSRNLMRLPNGEYTWPRLGPLFRGFQAVVPVRQFQLIQHRMNEIEARLVTQHTLSNRHKEEFGRLLHELTGHHFNVWFSQFPDGLPHTPGSKFEDFRRMV